MKHQSVSLNIRKATGFQTGKYQRECVECEEIQEKTTPKLTTVNVKNKTENAIKKSVTQFWKAAQKYDVNKMQKCFVKKPTSLFVKKRYTGNFVRKSNKKNLKYVITSIKLNGKKKAIVRVSCKYQDCYDIFYRCMEDVLNYVIKTGDTRDLVLDKYQYNRATKYNKKYKKRYAYKTVTLNMQKVGETWKIVSLSNGLIDAIHGNYNRAYKDYFK